MPIIDPTALQSGFDKFYHYQPFNASHLKTLLEGKLLYFSDPHAVNDPWDCKPVFDHRPLLLDLDLREKTIQSFQALQTPELLAHPLNAIYTEMLRNDDRELEEAIVRASKVLGDQMAVRRIYCLTPFPASTLMWSHYAKNHTGLCLEFDKHNALIGRARPCRYRKTYPVWTPWSVDDNPLDLVLAKAMDWCYEREFRIIASPVSPDWNLRLQGDYVPLPEGALRTIIIGSEAQNTDEIISVVRQYAPTLEIKQMRRVRNHYQLEVGEGSL